MSPYVPSQSASGLTGSNGIAVQGPGGVPLTTIAQGDINGDGIADVIIAAPSANKVYVVYGRAAGNPASVDLANLNGFDGFVIDGGATAGQFGAGISVADFDGDGIADIAIGDPDSGSGGAVTVIFGRKSWSEFGPHVSTDVLGPDEALFLTGPKGFGAALGHHVEEDSAGLLFGSVPHQALDIGSPGEPSINSYLIGPRDVVRPLGDSIAPLDGDGFGSIGQGQPYHYDYDNDYSGYDTASYGGAGATGMQPDWSGDGMSDRLCSAPLADTALAQDCGAAYIVFGQNGTVPQSVDVSTLDGSDGCAITGPTAGEELGRCFTQADLNGDGRLDIVLGARNAVYVIFDPSAGFTPSGFDLRSLDGSNGIRITGGQATDDFGCAVASGGDWNGDGIEDLVIGAAGANGGMGAAYVVFGRAAFSHAAYAAGQLVNGTTGVLFTGSSAGGHFGAAVDPGDFNRDGFTDIGIAAPGSGEGFVFFGGKPGEAVTRTGTAIGQTIRGGDFDDTLNGQGGNDVLIGAGGHDTLNGGSGFDIASYADRSSAVSVTLNGATAATVSVGGAAEDSVKAVEGIAGGSAGDTLTGDAGANWFRGGGGLDTLDGGGGSDTADFSDKTGNLFISLADSGDTVARVSSATDDTLRNIENIVGGSGADYIGGNSSINILIGGGGNDVLYGSDGDTLKGGAGNDQLSGGGADEYLDGGAGSDTADFTGLFNQVLTLSLAGAGEATAFINGVAATRLINVENVFSSFSDDTITGNAADNTINGGSGHDTLDGRGGIDTLSYAGRSDVIAVTLAGSAFVSVTANGVAEDDVRNFENVYGGGAGDMLAGDGNANVLTGNGGNDTLSGNGGADRLAGGSGNDSETGGAGNDRFIDDSGNDVMDGGSGSDTLSYGERFHVTGGSISVTLNGASDAAVTIGGVAEDTIRNIENIFGGLGDDSFTGDGRNNTLCGGTAGVTTSGDGSDTLSGMGGNDVLDGGMTGNDVLDGGAGKDWASFAMALSGVTVSLALAGPQNTGGAGSDTLTSIENIAGSGSADTLTGNAGGNALEGSAGNDTLVGGGGSDRLTGGTGADTLTGGTGKDIFVFTALSDSTAGAADTITAFVQGSDRIDLRGIDAMTGGGDDAFTFIGAAAFSGTAGELRFDSGGGQTTIMADSDGDGGADLVILIARALSLTGGDFLL